VRCSASDKTAAVEVTVRLVSGVPVLVYPADAAFDGVGGIVDDVEVLARLMGWLRAQQLVP
jgi:hypothetical protein